MHLCSTCKHSQTKSSSANPFPWILANTSWAMINTSRKRMSPDRFCTGHHQSLLTQPHHQPRKGQDEGEHEEVWSYRSLQDQLPSAPAISTRRNCWLKFCTTSDKPPNSTGEKRILSYKNYSCDETTKHQPRHCLVAKFHPMDFGTFPASNLKEHSEIAGDKFVEYLLQQGMNPHPSWLLFVNLSGKRAPAIYQILWSDSKIGTPSANQSAIVQGIATQPSEAVII